VRAKISSERAAAHTHIAGLAFYPTLVYMYLFGLGKMRPAGMYQVTVLIILVYLFADLFLHTIHFERRQKLAIRHSFYAVFIAAYTNKSLHMRIPGCYIIIPYRPRNAVPKFFRVSKLIFTPSLASAPPGKGFAANLV